MKKHDKQNKTSANIVLSIILIYSVIFWPVTYVQADTANTNNTTTTPALQNNTDSNNVSVANLPEPAKQNTKTKKLIRTIVSERKRSISAYNVGDIYQNDSTPCTTANGEDVCKALDLGYKRCAANFVPFGTVLEIEGYGECIVTDRMNSRFPNNVDIAMKYSEKKKAMQFGRRTLNVKIIKYTNTITDDKK